MRLAPVGVVASCTWEVKGWDGVLERAELTAERFVPNPFSGEAGSAAVPDGRPGALRTWTERSSSWAGWISR